VPGVRCAGTVHQKQQDGDNVLLGEHRKRDRRAKAALQRSRRAAFASHLVQVGHPDDGLRFPCAAHEPFTARERLILAQRNEWGCVHADRGIVCQAFDARFVAGRQPRFAISPSRRVGE
jgi:hypothetical protein